MGAIWATEFFETKDALYGNGTNREIRSFAWNHSHNNAVINRRARAKAALHIISHQHKLLEASLLKARQNVSADADAFVLQACHAIGQKTAGEGISLFNFKLDVIKCDLSWSFRGSNRSRLRRHWCRLRQGGFGGSLCRRRPLLAAGGSAENPSHARIFPSITIAQRHPPNGRARLHRALGHLLGARQIAQQSS